MTVERKLVPDDTMLALVRRREWLGKHAPTCPKCGTEQVQLIDHFTPNAAEWRCRLCRHQFKHEPT